MTTEPTPTATKKSYKDTLNLPQTAFAMEAKLVQNEPARLKRWQEERLYEKALTARAKSPKWILHDGPPFANGDIHMGHLLNKVLKDVFIRYKTMAGFQTPYVPGWDCHGLPIEHKISQELGSKAREMSTVEIRKLCHEYALKYVNVQSTQFQRLGILGDWANPYMTMAREYEAETLEVFARFVEAGLVYKQLKPVPWSVANQTALADAELDYKDIEDVSVYVEFPLTDPSKLRALAPASASDMDFERDRFSLLVWTTTPWTLPANKAIAVNPDAEYAVTTYIRNGVRRWAIVGEDITFDTGKPLTKLGMKTLESVRGKDLLGTEYTHPFIPTQTGRVVGAVYVTTVDGTGLVHTAPGHGEDDYETGLREGLEVYSPVLANGRFDDTVPEFIRGRTTKEANALIITELLQRDLLALQHAIKHSYPHDWRSKTPIIFRATEQWFVGIDTRYHLDSDPDWLASKSLRERVRAVVGLPSSRSDDAWFDANPSPLTDRQVWATERLVRFVPEWGQSRLLGMLESRPDWCISRQRAWGLPIPVFYNDKSEPLLTPASVRAVAKHFRMKGADAWFTDSPAELLGADFQYPPGFTSTNLRKEKDIFDVWFESGSSWHAVLQCRSYLNFPADLYLEGSDQHRGWFQLSLLPSLGATGQAPYKQVLTHGFIVKPDGTKVSKSDKEYVTAMQEVDRHGADLLRLWCCSVDYQGDIPASPQTLKDFGDKYRKIRNTLRYLLSNLYDFEPKRNAVEIPPNSFDGWAAAELDKLIVEVTAAYETYSLHRAFRLLHDFCSVQISAKYGNAMKDRLYCEAPDSPLRRRSQTVMHRCLLALTKLLAPMIVFTADETWEHIKHRANEECDLASVHLALLPKPSGDEPSEAQRQEWALLMELRDSALMQIDGLLRKFPKQIKPLDLEVIYRVDDDATRRMLQTYGADLEDLVGAGSHSFAEKATEGPAVVVEVVDRRETYKACARSWKRRRDVGEDAEFPDLTLRDAAVMKARAQGG